MLYCKFYFLLLSGNSLAQEWKSFGANEYFYEPSFVSNGYDGAVEMCNNYDATLAIITSEEQNQFIAYDLTGYQRELCSSAD